MDQLSEMYASTSPFAYVANNPISMRDPDGGWFNEDGSIGQAPPTWGLHGSQYNPTMSFSTSDGMHGGGGGYTPFGRTQAYADFMNSFQNGGDFSLKVNNGFMSWWTGGALGDANTAQEMVGHMMRLKSYTEDIWNGKLPRNEFIDTIINNKYYNLTSLGLDQAIAKSSGYLTKALETKSYVNFTLLNKYAKPAFRTDVAGSMLKTSKVATAAKFLKGVGNGLAVVGVAVGGYQFATGQITGTEFAVDTLMTGVGVFGGPIGAGISLIYFGSKTWYEFETGEKLFGTP